MSFTASRNKDLDHFLLLVTVVTKTEYSELSYCGCIGTWRQFPVLSNARKKTRPLALVSLKHACTSIVDENIGINPDWSQLGCDRMRSVNGNHPDAPLITTAHERREKTHARDERYTSRVGMCRGSREVPGNPVDLRRYFHSPKEPFPTVWSRTESLNL